MDLDTKLNMSLDQLIKTDTDTKKALRSTRAGPRRGRGPRRSDADKAAPAAQPKVKKDTAKPQSDRNRRNKPKKDADVEMQTDRRPAKAPTSKVILTTNREAKKVVTNDRRKVRITNIPFDVTWRDVKDAFSKVANVERCDVEKGEATLLFKSHADAVKAIGTYNGGNMNGRVIKAFFDQ